MSTDKPEAFVHHPPGSVYTIPGVRPGDSIQVIPPTLRSKRSCSTCTHWERPGNASNLGECRRHAPVPTRPPYTGAPARAQFPQTCETTWCSEWRPEL